jgi:hypothetical protein
MGGSSKAPTPPQTNYGNDIMSFVGGLQRGMPTVFNLEQSYRPQWTGLNLQDVNSMLGGMNGQAGLYGMQQQATDASLGMLGSSRTAELGQMTGQAGLARGLVQVVSPEQAAQVAAATQEAQRATTSAAGLTPEERRTAEQGARQAFAARGMLNSNASVLGEAMGREQMLSAKRAEATAARGMAYDMAGSFYSSPGLQALSSVPLGYQAGQQQVQMGLGAIGAAKPQLIDIGAGLNLGAADRQNQFQASSAKYASDQARKAANIQTGAAVAGTAIAAAALI